MDAVNWSSKAAPLKPPGEKFRSENSHNMGTFKETRLQTLTFLSLFLNNTTPLFIKEQLASSRLQNGEKLLAQLGCVQVYEPVNPQ